MDKVVSFLEKHVQWVVLGVAVLWLGYTVWSYVLTPPATITLGDERFMPGEVDAEIQQTVVRDLEESMNRSDFPTVRVPELAEQFVARMSTPDPAPLPDRWLASKPTEFEIPTPGNETPSPDGTPRIAGVNITPPTPSTVTVQSGRSIVSPDNTNVRLASGRPDVSWVTPVFEVSMAELKKQFAAAKLPQTVANTAFVDVDLVREEQMPDGSWGAQTIVAPVAAGMVIQPYPEEGDTLAQGAYLTWATANTANLIQPQFYEVIQGKQWVQPDPEVGDGFDPESYKGPLDALEPQQREAVLKARRERYQQQSQQQQAQRRGGGRGGMRGIPPGAAGPMGPPGGYMGPYGPGGPPTGPNGPAGPRYAPEDDERAAFYQSQRGGRRSSRFRGGPMMGAAGPMGPPGGLPPEAMAAMMRAAQGGAGGPMGPGGPMPVQSDDKDLPKGEFNPAQWAGRDKILVWGHDITVEPGKTYRYAMRYRIKNPLFQAENVALNPADAERFAFESELSNWTKPVTIPETLNFYVASGRPPSGNPRVKFEVFAWNNGKNASKTFEVAPGDMIGGRTNTGNFDTGWMLVDIRQDTNDVVLVSKNGEVQIRNFDRDQQDPTYKQLKDELKAEETAAAR